MPGLAPKETRQQTSVIDHRQRHQQGPLGIEPSILKRQTGGPRTTTKNWVIHAMLPVADVDHRVGVFGNCHSQTFEGLAHSLGVCHGNVQIAEPLRGSLSSTSYVGYCFVAASLLVRVIYWQRPWNL